MERNCQNLKRKENKQSNSPRIVCFFFWLGCSNFPTVSLRDVRLFNKFRMIWNTKFWNKSLRVFLETLPSKNEMRKVKERKTETKRENGEGRRKKMTRNDTTHGS
ncbi:hypothetical protein GHT06_013108 [Daphnia sinensis]|uniref:Uncharacterized protein n=1 Tax=Daphnia sinensis TaxID=1820382 RepID=A0AAD5LQK6_9CRUS|nr:hypothetical protein GHT06_013108 [Daphnia sinensis]